MQPHVAIVIRFKIIRRSIIAVIIIITCVYWRECICVCAVQLEASKRNRHCADNTSLLPGRGVSFFQWMIGEYSNHYAYFFKLGCNETLS